MNISQLKSDTYFLAGATSATYPDADLIRNINIANLDVATTIWESDGTWSHNDSNSGDPTYYRTVANASASYLIPTAAQRIEQVEIKDGSGNWVKLLPIDYSELSISPEEYLTGVGTPIKYHLEGNQIRLFPAPGTGYVTMSSGMAVRLNQNPSEFPTTATTTEPGFPSNFHRILSYAATLDFTKDEEDRKFFQAQKAILKNQLSRFYSKRWDEGRTTIKPRSRRRRYV
jgi:hypothetical protein